MTAFAPAEPGHVAPILDGPGALPNIHEVRHQLKSELARELHDQVAQQLTTMLIELQVFARDQKDHPDVMNQLGLIHASTREVLSNVRQILCDLRGAPSFAGELVASIRDELLPSFTERTGVKATLWASPSWPRLLPAQTCTHVYRIVQESINNANKHGAATSVHTALKTKRDGQLVISVRDDGRGFPCVDDSRPGSVGILGMRERAALLGGELEVRSRPEIGTTVTATFPKDVMGWRPRTAKFAS